MMFTFFQELNSNETDLTERDLISAASVKMNNLVQNLNIKFQKSDTIKDAQKVKGI